MVKIDSQVWKGRDGEHHRFTISALTHYLVWHVALLSLDTRNYRLYSQLNSAVFYFLLTQLNSAREEALKEWKTGQICGIRVPEENSDLHWMSKWRPCTARDLLHMGRVEKGEEMACRKLQNQALPSTSPSAKVVHIEYQSVLPKMKLKSRSWWYQEESYCWPYRWFRSNSISASWVERTLKQPLK